jgi:predicted TIM-barrel fold metal-dependent hydrolase
MRTGGANREGTSSRGMAAGLPLQLTRRSVLASATLLALPALADEPASRPAEPIIDIHQHTHYSGRTDEQLIAHQRRMGISQTILLPAGTPVDRPSTHDGKSNGLAAKCFGNESCLALARTHPNEFFFFANEVPDLPTAREEISKYLKLGALGIGESKFNLDCDAPEMQALFELAAESRVPILMHVQHETYNKHFERFGAMLEKYPRTTFIGHAQTFWANVDKEHADQTVLYPKTKVTPGGLTDQYLARYPNLYADLSAGSGLNSLLRDEDQARAFLDRHQDKILYGSDCNDLPGRGPTCSGFLAIQAVRRLAPSKAIERKILYENARKLFNLAPP